MTTLRLLADDLTGALDTAAEFVPLTGPIQAFWHGGGWRAGDTSSLPDSAALDTGTREAGEAAARTTTVAASGALAGAGIAFKKVDSLLRGQALAELAACFASGGWEQGVLAPAFPFQGRITRDGQQLAKANGGWVPAGPALVPALRALGVVAHSGRPGAPLPSGITVFDAVDDDGLRAAVAQAGGPGAPLLWCGTGGLAHALAGTATHPTFAELPGPVLGLFGSDQAVTAGQLAACAPHWCALPDGGAESAATLMRRLDVHGIGLATHALPANLTRAAAAGRIERAFAGLVQRLPAPGTLVVAGGETLRGLCLALGAASLEVRGRVMPGVPVSILRGGRWDGVTVVSKSGAFGHPHLLRELLRLPETERTVA